MGDEMGRIMSNEDLFRDFIESPILHPRQRKLAAILASELAEDIFARGLGPGDALPNESEMLERLDVSRGTLREALRVLETQGLISMRTGRGGGPVVAQPNARALAETLMVNFRALRVSFEEILFTRDTIEPALARQAALNRSNDDIDKLKASLSMMTETAWDDPAMLQRNREFHTAVALASHNRPLAIMWSAISTVADGQGLGAKYDEKLWAAGNAAHAKIVGAIEAGDPEAAEKAMSAHVDAYHYEMADAYPILLHTSIRTASEN